MPIMTTWRYINCYQNLLKRKQLNVFVLAVVLFFFSVGCEVMSSSSRDWKKTRQADTFEAYKQYAAAYPESKYAAEAMRFMREQAIDLVVEDALASANGNSPGDVKKPTVLVDGGTSQGVPGTEKSSVSFNALVQDPNDTGYQIDPSEAKRLKSAVVKVMNGGQLSEYSVADQQVILRVLSKAAMLRNGGGSYVIASFISIKPEPSGSGPILLSKSYMGGKGSKIVYGIPQKKPLLSSFSIMQKNAGIFELSTILPDDMLYHGFGDGGLMGGLESVLPACSGSIYRFENNVEGFITDHTIRPDEGQTLCFVVMPSGLIHIAGTGIVIEPDGSEVPVPLKH